MATREPPARAHFRPAGESITEDIRDVETAAGGNALGSTLRNIAAAARMESIAVRGGIMADFARRMAAARATANPQDLHGILRALKAERAAALAIAKRNQQRESSEKRQAAIQGMSTQRPNKAGPMKSPRTETRPAQLRNQFAGNSATIPYFC